MKKRPSILRNVEKLPLVAKKRVKHVTFEDLIGKDFSDEPIETVYTFICEAMDIADPSPGLLTQVTSQLKCPTIDWFEHHNLDLDNPSSSNPGHINTKISLQEFGEPSYTEHEQDHKSNIEISGALHPNDKLILRPEDDSLVCRNEPEELFRFMPMKLVDVKGLRGFDLFYELEAAFAELPDDFVVTMRGIQLAKRKRNETLEMSNDKVLIDMETLVTLGFYGGTFHDSTNVWSSRPQVCMPEHIRPVERSLEIHSMVKAYWSYLNSRKKLWEDADQAARIRELGRGLQEKRMQSDKRKEMQQPEELKMTIMEDKTEDGISKEKNEKKMKKKKKKSKSEQKEDSKERWDKQEKLEEATKA